LIGPFSHLQIGSIEFNVGPFYVGDTAILCEIAHS
jgi:hypothetical protein